MPKTIITLNCLITSPFETAIKCSSCGQYQSQILTRLPTSLAVLQPQLSRSHTPSPRLVSSLPNSTDLNAKIKWPPSIKQTPQKARKALTWTSASPSPTLNSTTSTLSSSCRTTTRLASLQLLFYGRTNISPCSSPGAASCSGCRMSQRSARRLTPIQVLSPTTSLLCWAGCTNTAACSSRSGSPPPPSSTARAQVRPAPQSATSPARAERT